MAQRREVDRFDIAEEHTRGKQGQRQVQERTVEKRPWIRDRRLVRMKACKLMLGSSISGVTYERVRIPKHDIGTYCRCSFARSSLPCRFSPAAAASPGSDPRTPGPD
eukprot:3818717-Rhodomonas_salina.4